MKKLMILMAFLVVALLQNVAAITQCSLNGTDLNQRYQPSAILMLNVTAIWSSTENLTNVTWNFDTSVSVTNNTINGTKTSTTRGDFTFGLGATAVTEGNYSVWASCTNDSSSNPGQALFVLNSSKVTIHFDRTAPSVGINSPNNYETQVPGANGIVFDYTPSDIFLANATLYFNDAAVKYANQNMTSAASNKFYYDQSTSGTFAWLVEVQDLAGNKQNSTTRNIVVQTAAQSGSPIVTSSSGQVISGGVEETTSGVPQSAGNSNLFWVIVIGVGALWIFKGKKKRR